jgi:hypothetical protein
MTGTDTLEHAVLRLRPDRTEPLEGLLAGAGPHLVEVVDVGSAANGDLLVLLSPPAARLSELLAAPGGLTAGEAVTVLVPLAGALERMHAGGVAHGGVGISAVVLDADGSPAWWVPEVPALRRRIGAVAFGEQVAADVTDFQGLCSTLLAPVGVPVPHAERLDALAAAIYAVAPAEPVRLVRPSEARPSGPPARLLPAVAVPVPSAPPRGPRGTRLPGAALEAARGVRARVWVALGAAAVLLVGALVLLPSGDDGRRASAMPAPSTTPPSSAATAPRRAEVAARSLDGGAAVTALLAERERCLTSGSESCLRTVDAVGSPVLGADLAAVRAGVEAVRIDPARVRVPASGGGTALGTAGGATVLAVRSQIGWRLRDVVAEPPADR